MSVAMPSLGRYSGPRDLQKFDDRDERLVTTQLHLHLEFLKVFVDA